MANKLQITSQGSGLPLVFIHGWGVNSAVWQPIIAPLASQYEVITVDLPGFASNNHVHLNEYSVINIAKLIIATINKPAVYIGWSLGGLIASELALSYAEQVIAAVTVASSPHFVEQANWPGIKPKVLKSFHQQLANNPEQTIAGFLKIQAMGSPNVRHDIKVIHDLVMQHKMAEQAVLDQSLSLLETSDYRDKIINITVPLLRLYGRLDGLVPRQVIQLIDELLPNSQSHVFQQSSHAPFISQPEEFTAQLTTWLSAINVSEKRCLL